MPEDQETKATASLTPFAPGNTQPSTSGAVIASPPRLFLVSDITRMADCKPKRGGGPLQGSTAHNCRSTYTLTHAERCTSLDTLELRTGLRRKTGVMGRCVCILAS